MTSSIIGCCIAGLRRELENRHVDYRGVEVVADVARDPQRANRIESIHMRIRIDCEGRGGAEREIADSVAAMYRNSAMIQTVKESIQLSDTTEII